MAESSTMRKRVERLEADVTDLKKVSVQLANLAIDQSERMDAGFQMVADRIDETNRRLDRLTEATIRERTSGADRLLRIEARLDRLEERVGRD
jgi:hypothetical protein